MVKNEIYEKVKDENVNKNISIKLTETARRKLAGRAGNWSEPQSETIAILLDVTEDLDYETKEELMAGGSTGEHTVDWILRLIENFDLEKTIIKKLLDQ